MALTNGQDQPAVRQRELGRQGLEGGQEKLLLRHFKSEEGGPAQPQLAGFKPVPASARTEATVSVVQSAWNVKGGAQALVYLAGYPVQSRQKLTGLAQGYKNVCERWSLDAFGMAKLLHLEEEIGLCDLILSGQVPPMTGDLKDRMAFVIGISIGLGELFDDDKDAELQWLNSTRSELGGVSPLEHMLKGDLLNVRDVVDLVDNARGLR